MYRTLSRRREQAKSSLGQAVSIADDMKIFFASALFAVMSLAGCAHTLEHGTVAMRISDQEAHVALSPADVKPGDHVAFVKDTCLGRKVGPNDPCHETKVAEGVVTSNLNEKYAAVRVKPGGNYEEGERVVKAP